MPAPLRVLVVDDSALYRQLLRNVLRDIPNVECVGAAKGGTEALEMVDTLKPDLLTLDVRMPDIDGIEVLRELRKRRSSAKALMVSSLTASGAQVTTDALLEGAFDFILKPAGGDACVNRQALHAALVEKIDAMRPSVDVKMAKPARSNSELIQPSARFEAVVIGTSTGGPVALREVLPAFPEDFPLPILIVQHMPAQYTHSLAERLNQMSPLEVVEACDGMTLEAGWAYLAPGGRHMKVARRAGKPVIQICDDAPEHGCRPAVDVLFRSVADALAGKVIAVVLTGMGRDGLEGCRQLKQRGAFVIAEHADSCVVYGMPKAVANEGLADCVVPLDQIASNIVRRVKRQ
ncbi:MAG TPA: chemotaxis response regulator protein-glutamate methylesterase [Gemmataceae bacterium]|nr:chemotaxis response regulator protein-glutamate methylesterase [Gemmataceae bacterium]